jgi:uncharacterized protein
LYLCKIVFIHLCFHFNRMSKTKNALGPPVVGADFIGRVLELEQAFHLLYLGNHLRIPAPRRVGKTSFTKALLAIAKEKGWKAIFVDVMGQKTELELVKKLLDAFEADKSWLTQKFNVVLKGARSALSKLELSVPLGEGLPEATFRWNSPQTADLRQKLEELVADLGNCLIVIDELPWLLARLEKQPDGQERTSDLLYWLRPLRQDKVEASHLAFPRWVFCGSISFESITERMRLTGAINDVDEFHLGAYPRHEAEECLVALSNNAENRFVMSPELRTAVIDYLQFCLPYYLQLLFAKLRAIEQEQGYQVTVADLPKAIERASEYSNLNTWFERLNEQYLPSDERLAKIILDQLCQVENRSRNQIERLLIKNSVAIEESKDRTAYLIRSLKRDGYLMENEGLYAFRSPLLKKYWFNNRIR